VVTDTRITHWPEEEAPTESAIRRHLAEERLSPYQWANGPGDTYAPHRHNYDKVIYVVSGSITFGLVDSGTEVYLERGDRLDLPAGITHNATVGPQGVVCLEAHR
jgi:quercetin dioxygenase-like cupin family protein